MTRITIADPKPEKATLQLEATIKYKKLPLLGADDLLESLTVTLFEERTRNVINGRLRQSIFGENGGSVSALGVITLQLDPLDMIMVNRQQQQEVHVALLEWMWGSPPQSGKFEVAFTVVDLALV